MTTIDTDEISALLDRKLAEHRERTFHNGRPPKVGLDAGTLIKLVGTMIAALGVAAGLAVFAFQTKTEAAIDHGLMRASEAEQHHAIKSASAARDAEIEKKAAVSDEVIRRLEHNVEKIGRAVGARGLQTSTEPPQP